MWLLISYLLGMIEEFPLSFRTITRLEKEEENKKKALEFNRKQVIQLQKHTAIHDAKDRLWAELQQKAQA